MSLSFYNTLTRRKDLFEPITPGQVQMYYCGVTVYDHCHLGHARACIVWDMVRRYLQWRGYRVRYVQNFTDIDDKILNRAQQEGSSMAAVSERYIQAYFEDMERLNILPADAYPRATHTMDGIQRLIAELEQKKFAYAAEGDVYYSVRNYAEYGKLSGRKLDDMQAGASGRVEDDPEGQKKHDPFDFALWKAAKPGEPFWPSPWGDGRPGWHIECSAMVREELGETIDIHAGGEDLIFPHHENEIAQSEVVTGHPLAHYWMHNGMVTVDGKKMSKSLGNFTTIRDLLDRKQVNPMAIRMFVLQGNYRKPIDFTDAAIAAAENGWATLQEGLLFADHQGAQLGWTDLTGVAPVDELVAAFNTSMDDDFNTAGGLAVLFEIAKELRRESNLIVHQGKPEGDPQLLAQKWRTLVELAAVLGLVAQPSDAVSAANGSDQALSDAAIEALLQQRLAARQAKDFAAADRIRDQLQAEGITLIDQAGGETRWHRS
jgi:cysteinyl-tRNA synthetase